MLFQIGLGIITGKLCVLRFSNGALESESMFCDSQTTYLRVILNKVISKRRVGK